MAGVNNHFVQQMEREMGELREKGFWDGLEYKGHSLPMIYYKRPIDMKPYEIGFLTGYLIQRAEGRLEREETTSRPSDLDVNHPADSDGCPGPD